MYSPKTSSLSVFGQNSFNSTKSAHFKNQDYTHHHSLHSANCYALVFDTFTGFPTITTTSFQSVLIIFKRNLVPTNMPQLILLVPSPWQPLIQFLVSMNLHILHIIWIIQQRVFCVWLPLLSVNAAVIWKIFI